MTDAIETTIKTLLNESLRELGLEGEVELEHPSDLSHGDFSCNIASHSHQALALAHTNYYTHLRALRDNSQHNVVHIRVLHA